MRDEQVSKPGQDRRRPGLGVIVGVLAVAVAVLAGNTAYERLSPAASISASGRAVAPAPPTPTQLPPAALEALLTEQRKLGETIDKLQKRQIELEQHVIQQGNWIGQLLYRTQDQMDRPRWEAEAKLLAPEFSPQELALLNRWEISTEPLSDTPKPASFQQTGTLQISKEGATRATGDYHQYTPGPEHVASDADWLAVQVGEPEMPLLRIDPELPRLELRIDGEATQHPRISANTRESISLHHNQKISHFFEFDTEPTFDSPHFWRYPALLPAAVLAPRTVAWNLTTTRGLRYHLFTTTLRDFSDRSEVQFPFRVSAMAYPLQRGKVDFNDLAKFAKLLQHRLDPQASINEVFSYARNRYVWGGTDLQIEPIDTFRAGIAGCGAISDLIGSMLEMNGIRYRLVGGFNPLWRVWAPGGGHTAIEIYDGSRWSYLDSFLDLYLPGVAARDFASNPEGKKTVISFLPGAHLDPQGFVKQALGETLTLADLFRYRTYGDRAGRLPLAYLMQLRSAEAKRLPQPSESSYGLGWPLRTVDVAFDPQHDLPETATIHVRARYVISVCSMRSYHNPGPCSDQAAMASEWTTTSFTIRPRQLLAERP